MISQVQNFTYNGFFVQFRKGFAKYTVKEFIKWTLDPGIGLFMCSDKQERLIPSCCLDTEYRKTLPEEPKLNPFAGIGVLFGEPSKS